MVFVQTRTAFHHLFCVVGQQRCPPAIHVVIDKCCAFRPVDRPTAAQVVAELEAIDVSELSEQVSLCVTTDAVDGASSALSPRPPVNQTPWENVIVDKKNSGDSDHNYYEANVPVKLTAEKEQPDAANGKEHNTQTSNNQHSGTFERYIRALLL